MLTKLDNMLATEIPFLMDSLPAELRQGVSGIGELGSKMNAMSTNMPTVPTPKTHTVSDVEATRQAAAKAAAQAAPPAPPTKEEEEETNPFAEEEEDENNPFGRETEEDLVPWLLQDEKDLRWDAEFEASGPVNGKLGAKEARQALMKTDVPTKSLRAIWDLSDIDKDGKLDAEEFAIAMHLCEMVKEGEEIPEGLEENMVPIGKR